MSQIEISQMYIHAYHDLGIFYENAREPYPSECCPPAGDLSDFPGTPDNTPAGGSRWFSIPGRRSTGTTIITGHWAALGLRIEDNHVAIDSGCVWGRQLTAIRLEDRKVFQVDCADSTIGER